MDAVDVRGGRAENLALRFNARSWTRFTLARCAFRSLRRKVTTRETCAGWAGAWTRNRPRLADHAQARRLSRRAPWLRRRRELANPSVVRVEPRRRRALRSSSSPPTRASTRPFAKGEDQFFTRNSRATLKKTIPNGTYYWRVRAVSADGSVSPWSVPRQLRKGWTLGRAVQAPTHWPIVSHPTNPLVLRWSAVPHTAKYLVTIASDFTRAHSFTLQRTTGAGGIRVSQRLHLSRAGSAHAG